MIELLLQAERALSVGLLDRAETLYRQVARADPRNSIAVVGLARVTLDRGDDEGALELARRALAIDPENVAAQRMVARLEEVIDYRVRIDDVTGTASGGDVVADVVVAPAPAVQDDPEATGEIAAAPGPAAEPPPEPLIQPTAEPVPEVAVAPEPESQPAAAPEPRRRRSFLDWLFRRR